MINTTTLHKRATRVLPEVIQTSGVLLEESGQRELAAMLLTFRRKSRGAILYRLSPATVKAMARSPLEYLAGATRSRQMFPCDGYLEYHPWRAARLPGQWLALMTRKTGTSVLGSELAFFTTEKRGHAVVVVVPDACFAAYLWRD